MSGAVLNWTPPGPVALAFLMSTASLAGIMGPRGGGKTSTCAVKIMRRSQEQPRSRIDGKRRYRCVIIRDQYRRYKRTTYPTVHKWIRPEWSEQSIHPDTGEKCICSTPQDAPGMQTFVWNDGTGDIFVWLDFLALGELTVEELMQGYEATDAYLGEWAQLPEDTVEHLSGTLGRYPGKEHCDVTDTRIFGDFNAPDQEHFLYRLFVEEKPAGAAFYRQPGGTDPGAENLANLPSNYYQKMIDLSRRWYVDRMVRNKWGYSRDGEPVYEEWDDEACMAAATLHPVQGAPIILGVDPGFRGPAAVFVQPMPGGQLRVLAEVVAQNLGAMHFADEVLRTIAQRFDGCEIALAWLDPYAFHENAVDPGRTWAEVFKARVRVRVKEAKTNAVGLRLDAVRRLLELRVDGRDPGLLVDPSCRRLRRGFNANYRYKRTPSGRSPEPEKNEYSDVHDALQYAALGTGGYELITRPRQGGMRRTAPRIERADRVVSWGARG